MQFIEVKTILSKLRQTDSYFGIGYNMNLYRGCQHGCIYCDTRSECYGVGELGEIRVKKNAVDLLRKELSAKRKYKATIGTGSMNDPYMPVERELQLTRKAMQLIAGFRFPVHVITKSDLVVRDTDILQEIARTYAAVSFTITAIDDHLSAKIEPNAPVSSARFRAMERLASAGIYTGVTLMPLLPYVNDTKQNIEEIVSRAKDAGASYVIPMFGVTLRKGSRDYLYGEFDKTFPGLKERYAKRFGEQYECFSPDYRLLSAVFHESAGKLGLKTRMNFYTPEPDIQLSLF